MPAEGGLSDVQRDVAVNLATKAAQDPKIQEEAKRRAQEAATAGGQHYVSSFRDYGQRVLSRPQIFCKMWRCCGDDVDWTDNFERWNIVWSQTQILCGIIYFCFLAVYCFNFTKRIEPWDFIYRGLGRMIYLVVALVFGHMGWHCVVNKQACCKGPGYAIWAIVLLIVSLSCLKGVMDSKGEKVEGALVWAYTAYCLLLLPSWYMCLACWKLKAAEGFSFRQTVRRVTGAAPPPQQQELVAPRATP